MSSTDRSAACVCAEINTRHCPVHGQGETTAAAGKYRTIVADPPWRVHQPPKWNYGEPGGKPNRPLPYETLAVDEIAALRVADLAAANCHLYLWTINRYIEDAYKVARAWGFAPSTLLTWCKPRKGLGVGGDVLVPVANGTHRVTATSSGRPDGDLDAEMSRHASPESSAANTASRKEAMNEARDVLAKAMFRAQFSDHYADEVDVEWAKRGLNETGYRASIVLGLLRDVGFDVREDADLAAWLRAES